MLLQLVLVLVDKLDYCEYLALFQQEPSVHTEVGGN